MSVLEPRSRSAARPPNLHGGRLSVVCCFGAIAIGIVALTGYALANASIASLGAGRPVPLVTALSLIVLGAGLLALRSPAPAGLLTARRAALAVIVLAAANLLSVAFSRHIDEWQVWAAHGGVNVHAYPIAALLLIASASALVLMTTRRDFAGHAIASAVLLICGAYLLSHVLQVPPFLDPSRLLAPVAAAACGLALISVAELLARPRGWVVPLLSRTPAGMMARLLLPAAFVVPFLALGLRDLTALFGPEAYLAVFVAVHAFFGVAVVLSVGAILHKRESNRVRLAIAAIVDASTDAIIGTSIDGLIESWNGGAEQMYGYTAVEAIGRSVTMLAPAERQDEAPGFLERIRRGERIGPFETVRVTKDGRLVDVWLSVSPILDDDGSLVGASSIAHDITLRKQEHEALRSSEERLQLAQRVAGLGHFSWDIQNNTTARSHGLLALYGLPSGTLNGRVESWKEQVFPEDVSLVEAEIQKSLTSGDFSCDFRVVWPDVSIHWLHERAKVFFSDDGKPLRMAGVSMDITERVVTEQALRESEAALAEAQQIAHIGSWLLDSESGEMLVSAEAFRIFAVEPRPLAPMQLFLDRIHEEDRAALEADIAAALQTGKLDVEVRIVTPDGTRVAHIVARKREAGEGRPGLVGTTQDITERKAAEEALRRHSDSLERSNLDLERFNRAAVGREMRMIELKRQINELSTELGRPVPYRLLAEDETPAQETQ